MLSSSYIYPHRARRNLHLFYILSTMRTSFKFSASLLLVFPLFHSSQALGKRETCRNVPGSAGFPSAGAWNALNETISGRLVETVPSAKYCATLPGGCTDAQWTSALFRSTIPGAMNKVNFEQDYDLNPVSLCLLNSTTCEQGDVPIYSVEAQTAGDIQAAIEFASTHNLRLVVKSSGHDFLGRSTARNSLLVRTASFKNLAFTDAFYVGTQNMGSAVTVGSGVHLQDLYTQTKAQGKVAVGGSAATVSVAGGYLQGAGHSALGPLFGLAADNVLEFHVVVASGDLLQVNNISNPDLFYALRGGGAGSWGVIVNATIRTFPTFSGTFSLIELGATTNAAAGALAGVHAQHIFDLDAVRAGQYFWLEKSGNLSVLAINTFTPNTTVDEGTTLLMPFLTDALAVPGVFLIEKEIVNMNVNDALYMADDVAATFEVQGSRLIPEAAYRDAGAPATVQKVYTQLLDGGAVQILGNLVAGGQVSDNADIESAVNPAWRTAKTHVIVVNFWNETSSVQEVNTVRNEFQTNQLPILEQLSGSHAGSYSNEGDALEPNFQTTFYGPNYAKLSAIKAKYDPNDLFMVAAGVGSERWDNTGMCTV
ncbi:FAD-binding domain-containing protein [Mycena vitilis]|nr:FAD-binding domain-containing protein [Mycena vitilis]